MRFVVRTNRRRNLTSGQWAAVAVEAEEVVNRLEGQARGRQSENAPRKGQQGFQKKSVVPEKFPEPQEDNSGETRERIAEEFDTNPRYVQDAKKIKRQAPDLAGYVKDGTLAIPSAKALLKADEVFYRFRKIPLSGENYKLKCFPWGSTSCRVSGKCRPS